MNSRIHIKGLLHTVTPMHISSPESYSVSDDGHINKTNGRPLTRTVTKRIPLRFNEVDESGRTNVEIPFISPNTVRRGISRSCAKVIHDIWKNRGIQISLADYHSMMSGSKSSNPSKTELDLETFNLYQKDLFVGLFGGLGQIYPSSFISGEGLPCLTRLVDKGLIPEEYRESSIPENFRLSSVMYMHRVDDALSFRDPECDTIIKNFNEELLEAQGRALKDKDRKKAKEDGEVAAKKTSLANMMAYELIPNDVPFFIELKLKKHVNDAQIGLFLEGFQQYFKNNTIGGLARFGCGKVRPELSISIDGEPDIPLFETSGNGIALNSELSSFLDAMSEEALEYTPENLRRLDI